MLKNLLAIITLAALLTSCGSGDGEKKKEGATDEAVAAIEFATLIDAPEDYLDKEITLEGSVVHVCKHSGKKMFIVGENPDIRLHISAGEEVPKFPVEMEGSVIAVTGKLGKIVAAAPKPEGEEHKEGEEKEGEEKEVKAVAITADEDCATEVAVAEQPVLADYVLHYVAHEEISKAEVAEEEVAEEEVAGEEK